MKYADSLVLALVGWGLFVAGQVCWYANRLLAFHELTVLYMVPGAAVVGVIFTIGDLRNRAFRRQAVIALFVCVLLLAVDFLFVRDQMLR